MKEKLNKNTFISRAKEIHGDKYDYSKTVYVKAKEGTDKAAIEAGKLLVNEILYNTIDNTI